MKDALYMLAIIINIWIVGFILADDLMTRLVMFFGIFIYAILSVTLGKILMRN